MIHIKKIKKLTILKLLLLEIYFNFVLTNVLLLFCQDYTGVIVKVTGRATNV